MGKKKIALLGSTGTIGVNTLELVEAFPDKYEVVLLAAHTSGDKLIEQAKKFKPRFVTVGSASVSSVKAALPGITVGSADNLIEEAIAASDLVVVGIVGFAALIPTLMAVRQGKTIAIANKESLVVSGKLIVSEAARCGARLLPVDSEHNALFQILEGVDRKQVDALILTASGGPLLRLPNLALEKVTPAIAVNHPNWKMGPKISVDSATLMNKGLELIEAHFLFEVPENQLEVWVHPQSIVHGAALLTDGSILAHLSRPDMKLSIGYALEYPERLPNPVPRLKLSELSKLEFMEPDLVRFPCLRLAREALRAGTAHLIALNATNEIAVHAFLDGKVLFSQIPELIEQVLSRAWSVSETDLEAMIALDSEVRRVAIDLTLRK